MNTARIWQAGRFRLTLDRPLVMGIVNLTPDSFSDGGRYFGSTAQALAHAETLLRDGADILDIGGESTRPGAQNIGFDEECRRIAPVLRELSAWNIPVSLDTRHTAVMRHALDQGWCDIINDVQALEDHGAVELLAQQADTGICLMHMQGSPQTMQRQPHYRDVVAEVSGYLKTRTEACLAAGIARERLMADPGFGFGKTTAHNTALMHGLSAIADATGLPVLAALSRKRSIGELTGRNIPEERIHGSVAAALAAVSQGAAAVRVHDVRATADALKIWQAFAPVPKR